MRNISVRTCETCAIDHEKHLEHEGKTLLLRLHQIKFKMRLKGKSFLQGNSVIGLDSQNHHASLVFKKTKLKTSLICPHPAYCD